MKKKLNKCCERPYKLIFIDMNMPIMDGVETLNEIKHL
jgi:CheY-like chemotaxis protein